MGYIKNKIFHLKELYVAWGEIGLQEISRRKPIPKDREEPTIKEAAIQVSLEKLPLVK